MIPIVSTKWNPTMVIKDSFNDRLIILAPLHLNRSQQRHSILSRPGRAQSFIRTDKGTPLFAAKLFHWNLPHHSARMIGIVWTETKTKKVILIAGHEPQWKQLYISCFPSTPVVKYCQVRTKFSTWLSFPNGVRLLHPRGIRPYYFRIPGTVRWGVLQFRLHFQWKLWLGSKMRPDQQNVVLLTPSHSIQARKEEMKMRSRFWKSITNAIDCKNAIMLL